MSWRACTRTIAAGCSISSTNIAGGEVRRRPRRSKTRSSCCSSAPSATGINELYRSGALKDEARRASSGELDLRQAHLANHSHRTRASGAPNLLVDGAKMKREGRDSMRTRSPKLRKGVLGAPEAMVSSIRVSARQENRATVALERCPSRRSCGAKLARARAMRDQRRKIKGHVDARFGGRPATAPFDVAAEPGAAVFPPSQAVPSSSLVTATGEKAVAGLDW